MLHIICIIADDGNIDDLMDDGSDDDGSDDEDGGVISLRRLYVLSFNHLRD